MPKIAKIINEKGLPNNWQALDMYKKAKIF